MNDIIQHWLDHGVIIPAPQTLEIAPDVPEDAVEPGAILHAGTKLSGASVHVGTGSELGREAPVAIEDCQLGAKVALKGGYFQKSVFLDGAAMGYGAHVREGTLLEEGAELAHTVGLKQTIFFPFAVGGSLINFCDALLSGGTSRKVHSEIGSSFIHFNYTPRGDKATASLFGDVPRGVMLDQPPIFLGGQGGVVGPVCVEFGTVLAAGNILRRDVEKPDQLVIPPAVPAATLPFSRSYRSTTRIFRDCIHYLANLAALEAWYRVVRQTFMLATPSGAACHAGALRALAVIRKERVKRLDAVAEALRAQTADEPLAIAQAHAADLARWEALRPRLATPPAELWEAASPERDAFLQAFVATDAALSYPDRIHAVSAPARAQGTAWLQGIVDQLSTVLKPN